MYDTLQHLHDVPYHVLATAMSSRESRGSGRQEPVLLVTQFGKGRVFHQVLGHVWPADEPDMTALQNPNFVRTTVRGSEWAATGQVTVD